MLGYEVVVTNSGTGDAADVSLYNTIPPQIDPASTTWSCLGAGDGAVCEPSGSGDLNSGNIVIPAGRALTWLVSASVRAQAVGDSVVYTVGAGLSGGVDVSVSDTDLLVLFRNGFD